MSIIRVLPQIVRINNNGLYEKIDAGEDLVEASGVSFTYPKSSENSPDERPALKNINLTIKKGEFCAVLGHNGSGKSTLAKLMNALLIPTEGKITINGYDSSTDDNVWQIRQSAGMVFQNPDNQIIATVVEEDIAFGPENLGIDPKEIRARVDASLNDVGMREYTSHAPHFLSGGQKQRVAIAGVLAMRPELIILDEPTAMLDPIGRRDVIETVMMLNREYGITIVFITHFMDEAVRADRVIVMENGEIVMDGPPREIFMEAEKLRGLSLDVPQMAELGLKLKRAGYVLPDGIISIDEMVDALCRLKSRI